MRVRRTHLDTVLIVLFMLIAAFFVLSTVYGGVLHRTFVPAGDTWDGAIGFYIDSKSDIGAWWRQHYDHRILLAKFFFWMDLEWLGGRAVIYLPLHLSLLFLVACTYFCFYRKVIGRAGQEGRNLLIAGMLCLVFAFSWMQRENIIWEFQSEFILVYLLPLLAFFLYAKSVSEEKAYLFFASLVLAWLSAYAMANGILALPLLAVAGFLFRDSAKRIALIIVLSVLSIAVFFIGYEKTHGSSAGHVMLEEYPLKIVYFALVYLGNPIFIATRSAVLASAAAVIALGYLACAGTAVLRSRQNPFVVALLVYALYICMTAGLTAFGRSQVPLELAASSRYTTPGLTFWMVMVLLLLSRASFSVKYYSGLLRCVFIACSFLLMGTQLSSLYYARSVLWLPFHKEVAALALQLEIDDKKAKKYLHPLSEDRDAAFDRARQARLSIFSDEKMYLARLIGSEVPEEWVRCDANVLKSDIADRAKKAYRVKGVVQADGEYQYVLFSNEQGVVTGLAFLGVPIYRDSKKTTPELDWFLNVRNPNSFAGYLLGGSVQRSYCK
ncbi:MAG: hypothetical protein ACRCTL_06610 [Pseudomonas sp.]